MSWNTHGLLAGKVRFRHILFQHDIVLLQETFVPTRQEDQLVYPDEYECFVSSRPQAKDLRHSGGGVAAFVRRELNATALPTSAEGDVLVL